MFVPREQQVKAARRKKSMEYVHQAQYYETDQMGIIHHSNYIRWMEEARIAYMDEMDFPYKKWKQQESSVLCCS